MRSSLVATPQVPPFGLGRNLAGGQHPTHLCHHATRFLHTKAGTYKLFRTNFGCPEEDGSLAASRSVSRCCSKGFAVSSIRPPRVQMARPGPSPITVPSFGAGRGGGTDGTRQTNNSPPCLSRHTRLYLRVFHSNRFFTHLINRWTGGLGHAPQGDPMPTAIPPILPRSR